jgi:hypothetical protein
MKPQERADVLNDIQRMLEAKEYNLCIAGYNDGGDDGLFEVYLMRDEDEQVNCVKCKHYYETEDDRGIHSHCVIDKLHRLAEEAENAEVRKGIIKAIEELNDTRNSDSDRTDSDSDRVERVKPGGRFIIEVAESLWNCNDPLSKTKLYRIKGFESLTFTENDLKKLERI